MKQNIIADIQSTPSTMHSTMLLTKMLIALAGAISVFGIVFAASSSTTAHDTRVFISDGAAIVAMREKGVSWEDVGRAYPRTRVDEINDN